MNVFEKAKVADPKPKAKTAKKIEVEMVGVKKLAELDALIGALSTMRSTLDGDLKSKAFERFMTEGRNDSFNAVDCDAGASMQLRLRSSASGFSEDELSLLAQHELKPVRNESVPEMFGINTKYTADMDLLGKVSKAIESIVPEDFIVKQEAKFKSVSSDELIREAFAKKMPAEVIKTLTTQAMRVSGGSINIAKVLEDVKGYLVVEEQVQSEDLMAKLRASLKAA